MSLSVKSVGAVANPIRKNISFTSTEEVEDPVHAYIARMEKGNGIRIGTRKGRLQGALAGISAILAVLWWLYSNGNISFKGL